MSRIIYRDGQAPVVIDNRLAAAYGAQLIAAEKKRAHDELEGTARTPGTAPTWRQINATRGAYDQETAAAIFAIVDARRAQEDAFTAAVEAILADAELDNAGKLAALDAL